MNPASADQLIRVEDPRADRRRREEQDSTTQYIRRLHAVVLYSVIAVIVVTGCVMLVLYSVGGLQIPGSRILQTAVGEGAGPPGAASAVRSAGRQRPHASGLHGLTSPGIGTPVMNRLTPRTRRP